MITRIVVIDPHPRDVRDDVIVYQVPEKSRAFELLADMLTREGFQWVEVPSTERRKRESSPTR